MNTPNWHDAHNATDMHIARMQGFAEILYEVATEHPALCKNELLANGILALIRAIKEDARQLEELHSVEWKLKPNAASG
ncbi:hypothetical protein E4191_10525 [Paracoccus liaowanqingii]|uniref:Uncharacterized protein n=1 Tax=Paracoccus liaowanqingii TaxID=2560053 RepID=A0A4P7HLI4_9RHOB|nr:hypothetical protein [Paracoccus liaowanqingii]QBX35089.1 hypothetical protein E4191_10525 [Paracoccus liaowanqingii]